ncbi:MAG: pyridoxamine 5'-phosphate oxidase family protein [Sphaerospermopsis kisseleviana]|jgi:general stress protein 26|uniref:Pyridoxamine 5'-phosphate oxidase-like FMN-binding protein n=3 Tax=Sphaerospermopsis TaxID=752201 RepID=A0A480A8X4_9CYAN|nr:MULTISPECIES: pyridoxamine 5'-phosphate oxidase family protein [Sphaerospermopsis]MEB3151728.1 pyridoxamine 5'-phosphate oxidase family protein [Sphaerospermopsis sp.]BAZ80748.1 pyridoxamine 5'-phosphate oxidase-like FMN-binding protein [Sphaerospermopsis kisseleviana NIES-73]MBC5795771.1 pyridoxamine 5'-phosphate oxidase family protein [Sphaerospermopsis sp. LEGE 00249]MBD2132509.1 pyridoxamine 5'-phosphate oxidase family protein [Sphaerospermopsis sp. FACHB-1094]MBD2148307.1 pyridoxamine 
MANSQEHNQKTQQLRTLIKDIDNAMLTTVDDDGSLHSRPMSIFSDIDADGKLWFFTFADSHKVLEIQRRQQVNVSFSSPDQQRYISISGTAELVKDRNKLQEKWKPELQTWFPQGIDEPNIALLKVNINKADYWESSSSFIPQKISFLELSHR